MNPTGNEMTLTKDDIPKLRVAIHGGRAVFSGLVVYRGIGMDHRPAHDILAALESGDPEVTIRYEDWQVIRSEEENAYAGNHHLDGGETGPAEGEPQGGQGGG